MSSLDSARLIQLVCDEQASAEQCSELEQLALADPSVLRAYVEAMNVHAALVWDAAGGLMLSCEALAASPREAAPHTRGWTKRAAALAAIAATALVAGGLLLMQPLAPEAVAVDEPNPPGHIDELPEASPDVAESPQGSTPLANHPRHDAGSSSPVETMGGSPASTADDAVATSERPGSSTDSPPSDRILAVEAAENRDGRNDTPGDGPRGDLASLAEASPSTTPEEAIARIDAAIAARWAEEDVAPSPHAAAGDWLRRASLDLKGRIPTRGEMARYLPETDREVDRRAMREQFVADAVTSSEFARHFATRWATLLVGRSPDRLESRRRLRGWLAEQIEEHQGWDETAGQLIAAVGPEDHPPTNFLLAHLNNQAVPATAITSRVLLGRQVQCTQCHRHPWGEAGQDQFWTLNAFFKQTEVRTVERDGRRVRELVDRTAAGPTYYETLGGVMQVAYPEWDGRAIDREAPDRRRQLVALLTSGGDRTLAEAMAARLWAEMIGAPLTPVVDDLGPHASVSHPEVLVALTDAFLASDYDIAELARLIARTDVYARSSEAVCEHDHPEAGGVPLYTRTYVKSLSPEQIYDSIVTAARGRQGDRAGLPSRDDWTSRFYQAQQNEENGDLSTFDGSVNQALALMNGELIAAACKPGEADALAAALETGQRLPERLAEVLSLALGRPATQAERLQLARLLSPAIRQYAAAMPPEVATDEGLRDVFWAALNSSRFALNY